MQYPTSYMLVPRTIFCKSMYCTNARHQLVNLNARYRDIGGQKLFNIPYSTINSQFYSTGFL